MLQLFQKNIAIQSNEGELLLQQAIAFSLQVYVSKSNLGAPAVPM